MAKATRMHGVVGVDRWRMPARAGMEQQLRWSHPRVPQWMLWGGRRREMQPSGLVQPRLWGGRRFGTIPRPRRRPLCQRVVQRRKRRKRRSLLPRRGRLWKRCPRLHLQARSSFKCNVSRSCSRLLARRRPGICQWRARWSRHRLRWMCWRCLQSRSRRLWVPPFRSSLFQRRRMQAERQRRRKGKEERRRHPRLVPGML